MNIMSLVTDRIMANLETGIIPWEKPWCTVDGAYNRFSGKTYSILNQMLLGGDCKEFATYKQWTKAGFTLRRNANARMVVFWRFPDEDDPDVVPAENNKQADRSADHDNCDHCSNNLDRKRKSPILRYYKVFGIDDIEESPSPIRTTSTELSSLEPIERAEKLIHTYMSREGIRLECGGDSAFYSPLRDMICIPSLSSFKSSEFFYETIMHECCHSTGRENRLNRNGLRSITFGSETYSKEELIAEIGSACLMHHLGINTDATERNASAYIQGWLHALRNDSRMVVYASVQAQKAVNFILEGCNV